HRGAAPPGGPRAGAAQAKPRPRRPRSARPRRAPRSHSRRDGSLRRLLVQQLEPLLRLREELGRGLLVLVALGQVLLQQPEAVAQMRELVQLVGHEVLLGLRELISLEVTLVDDPLDLRTQPVATRNLRRLAPHTALA